MGQNGSFWVQNGHFGPFYMSFHIKWRSGATPQTFYVEKTYEIGPCQKKRQKNRSFWKKTTTFHGDF